MTIETTDMPASNSRIAKNSLMLYFRMLFQMVVALYTSRVILQALGQIDYGIYDVVGGVIIVISFLNNAMSLSVQRFLTFYLGQNDLVLLRKVFSTAVVVQVIVALLVILIGESIGLWFLYNYMNIPETRLPQASTVFHLSLLASAVSIIGIPYYASIIAHEKMGVFSLISILETTLKLIIAIILPLYFSDRLVLYGLLMLGVVIIVRVIYLLYCSSHFLETKFKFVWDKELFTEMISFAGWSLAGNMSFLAYTQGTNILLNIFFGPAVNAARGIGFQVQGAISSFITNFQMAINPQIIKSYSSNDNETMHRLIFASSKFSFLLMLLLSLPLIIEMPFVLKLWLGEYPIYAVVFCRWLLCSALMTSLSNPLHIGINATGVIKKYNIITGGFGLSILPLSYLALKLGLEPQSVFVVQVVILTISVFVLIKLCAEQFNLSVKKFLLEVIFKVALVTFMASILPVTFKYYMQEGVLRLTLIVISSMIYTSVLVWFIGLERAEQSMLISYYKKFTTRNVIAS